MTHYKRICKHCGINYIWQGSGYSCYDNYNNRDYCPICQKAIIEALEKISIKRKVEYVETILTEKEFDLLLKVEDLYRDYLKHNSENFSLAAIAKRVFVNLVDSKTFKSYYTHYITYGFFPIEKAKEKIKDNKFYNDERYIAFPVHKNDNKIIAFIPYWVNIETKEAEEIAYGK